MDMIDIHTHHPDRPKAIIQANIEDGLKPGFLYSVGVHPWDTPTDFSLENLCEAVAHDSVVAIGETGLDALRGADLEEQERVFRWHVTASERMEKPMILHVVKAWGRMMSLHRELSPGQPWIVHGFRGKPMLARQLVAEGFYLSIGEKFNRESVAEIPDNRLLCETDESLLPIAEIVARVADARGETPETVGKTVLDNARRLFHLPSGICR